MAIIKKDGFEFLDKEGVPHSLIITGSNLEKEILYVNNNDIKSLYLTYFKSKSVLNLEFMKDVEKIEEVNLNDLDIDYSGLYYLKNLKFLTVSVKNKNQHLDYSMFENLELLYTDWYEKFSDLSKNKKLKHLSLFRFNPKNKSLNNFNIPNSLLNFEVVSSNISNLEGLKSLSLNNLEFHYCKNLIDIQGIKDVCKNLKSIVFESCKNILSFERLSECKKLEKIIVGDCGNIDTLSWLKNLNNVRHISFYNSILLDGDVSPCVGIEYVNFKNKSTYNYKVDDFGGS